MGHRIHRLTITTTGYSTVKCSCGWYPKENVFHSETAARVAWMNDHDVLPTERSGRITYKRPKKK